jgi:RNA polymerase sigma-70 factor, ECF subfamily
MNADQAMTAYAQGDAAAFEIVYEVVAPRIEGYVRRKVRDSARVEDIVQQTFENMHKARGRFIPGSDVINWAFAIARNLVIDTGKKAGRESSADMTENEPMGAVLAAAVAGGEELFLARETGALLVRTFVGLTKLQQEVFELVKLEGLSYQQAAAMLGVTVPSVRMCAHRASLSLREAVGGGDPLPGPPAVLA